MAVERAGVHAWPKSPQGQADRLVLGMDRAVHHRLEVVTVVTIRVGTWDPREQGWWDLRRPARVAWLKAHHLPVKDIYRIEFYVAGGPRARIYSYHRDKDGHLYIAAGTGMAAVEEVRDEPLTDLPPEELL